MRIEGGRNLRPAKKKRLEARRINWKRYVLSPRVGDRKKERKKERNTIHSNFSNENFSYVHRMSREKRRRTFVAEASFPRSLELLSLFSSPSPSLISLNSDRDRRRRRTIKVLINRPRSRTFPPSPLFAGEGEKFQTDFYLKTFLSNSFSSEKFFFFVYK